LFGRGDDRNNGQNPEKPFCVRVPVKMVSVARKLSTIEEQRKEQNYFSEEITGTDVTNPETNLGSSLRENFGFRDNNNNNNNFL
jgi:hypothetical protein